MSPYYVAAFEVPPVPVEIASLGDLCRGQETFRYKALHGFALHTDWRRLRFTLRFDTSHATFFAFQNWVNARALRFTSVRHPGAAGRWPNFERFDEEYYERRIQATGRPRGEAMYEHLYEICARMRALAEAEGRVLGLYELPGDAIPRRAVPAEW